MKQVSSINFTISNRKGILEQTSGAMNEETAWGHLRPYLHCHQNKMELKVLGFRAGDLQLDRGILTLSHC